MNRQYIGARYVPKFFKHNGSNNWISNITYEALTVVTYLNDTYTSRKPVPNNVGNPADNPEYWALTGAFNSQLSQLSTDVNNLSNDVTAIRTALNGEIVVIDSTLNEVDPNNIKMARRIISGSAFDALEITANKAIILGTCAYNNESESWWSNDLYPGKYQNIKSVEYELTVTNLAAGGHTDTVISTALANTHIIGYDVRWTNTTVLDVGLITKGLSTYANITNTYSSTISDTGTITIYYIDEQNEVLAQSLTDTLGAKLRVNPDTGKTYLQVVSALRSQYDVGDRFRVAILKFDNFITFT